VVESVHIKNLSSFRRSDLFRGIEETYSMTKRPPEPDSTQLAFEK
jgi:hypothetical protein